MKSGGKAAGAESRVPRARGRPKAAEGGNILSRELITQKALAVAGEEGFAALSMHRLAEECGVTPRALYNHVASRQDLIDAVAARMMRAVPRSRLDAPDWRDSLGDLYRDAREVYRSFPRATLISLDETVTTTGVDPRRVEMTEDLLQFFTGIGLSLSQAITARDSFLFDVFSFVLLVDYRFDRAGAEVRTAMVQPVPQAWLDAHSDIDAPLSRRAARSASPSSDERFDALIAMRVAAIEWLLAQA